MQVTFAATVAPEAGLAAASGVAHSPQNFSPTSFRAPHVGQAAASGACALRAELATDAVLSAAVAADQVRPSGDVMRWSVPQGPGSDMRPATCGQTAAT